MPSSTNILSEAYWADLSATPVSSSDLKTVLLNASCQHASRFRHVLLQPGKVERHSQSFWREAEMLSNLNHPNVLRFYGVVVESHAEPNVIGIMTEYMKGGSLSAFLRYTCV